MIERDVNVWQRDGWQQDSMQRLQLRHRLGSCFQTQSTLSRKEKCWSTLSSARTGWKAGADVQVRFRLPCQTDVQLMHWNLRLDNPKYKESEIQMINLTHQNRTKQTLNHFKPGLLHICKVHMLHTDQTRAGLRSKERKQNCLCPVLYIVVPTFSWLTASPPAVGEGGCWVMNWD